MKAMTANILRKPKLKWSWNLELYSVEINNSFGFAFRHIIMLKSTVTRVKGVIFFTKIHEGAPNQSILLVPDFEFAFANDLPKYMRKLKYMYIYIYIYMYMYIYIYLFVYLFSFSQQYIY